MNLRASPLPTTEECACGAVGYVCQCWACRRGVKARLPLSALIPHDLYHKETTVRALTVPQSPALKSRSRAEVLQREAVCLSLPEGQRPQERRSASF